MHAYFSHLKFVISNCFQLGCVCKTGSWKSWPLHSGLKRGPGVGFEKVGMLRWHHSGQSAGSKAQGREGEVGASVGWLPVWVWVTVEYGFHGRRAISPLLTGLHPHPVSLFSGLGTCSSLCLTCSAPLCRHILCSLQTPSLPREPF